MRKIILLMLVSSLAYSQNMIIKVEKGITFTGNLAQKYEQIMGHVEKVNGKTWMCFPVSGTYFIGETVALVDGFPVPYEIDGEVKIKTKKLDLVQIDFKTKKKKKIKNGSLSDCHGYPDKAKEKIERMLLKNLRKK